MRQLIDELKRPAVIRVSVARAVATRIMQAFALLPGLGFPLLLIFSAA